MERLAPVLEPGDLARYTARFLRSVGWYSHRPDDPTHGWGEVVKVTPLGRHHSVAVRWSDGTERRVLSVNLQRKGAPERPGVDFDPDMHATVSPNPNQPTAKGAR